MRKILKHLPDNRIACPDCKIRIGIHSLSDRDLRCPCCGEAFLAVIDHSIPSLRGLGVHP